MTFGLLQSSFDQVADLAPVGRIPCLKHRQQLQQQQLLKQQSDHVRRVSCGRCLHCAAQNALATQAGTQLCPPLCNSWDWPGGLPSPYLYFFIRSKELQCQYILAAGIASDQVWRPDGVVGGSLQPSMLLQARRRPSLSILLPNTYTEIKQGATVEYLGSWLDFHCSFPQRAITIPPLPLLGQPAGGVAQGHSSHSSSSTGTTTQYGLRHSPPHPSASLSHLLTLVPGAQPLPLPWNSLDMSLAVPTLPPPDGSQLCASFLHGQQDLWRLPLAPLPQPFRVGLPQDRHPGLPLPLLPHHHLEGVGSQPSEPHAPYQPCYCY